MVSEREIASYGYDAGSRITSVTQNLWAQRTVITTVNGKPQTTTELYQTPITWTAGYDRRNRLTSFARAGASSTYTYDANSNRLTAIETAAGTTDLDALFDQPEMRQSTDQALAIEGTSNRLLGFTQTVTSDGPKGASTVTSQVNYTVDANGAMTSDGLRTFEYDATRRLARVKVLHNGEAASVEYLTNALGQRVFKSEPIPQETGTTPEEQSFSNWLRKLLGWVFVKGQGAKSMLGISFVYDEAGNLLGEYDNGTAAGHGRTEIIWLPTDSGQAIPIGLYRNGKFYQMGFPGQYRDADTGTFYNLMRDSYDAMVGRYRQPDPIRLLGGWNQFVYAAGNTLMFTDRRGLDNPSMGPYGPGPNNYGKGTNPVTQANQAWADFRRNYSDMRDANTINADKYFHCKANCEATRRGSSGESAACLISDVREWTDQHLKGDPASASLADHAANAVGRSGALSSTQSCDAVCATFRLNGLPSKY